MQKAARNKKTALLAVLLIVAVVSSVLLCAGLFAMPQSDFQIGEVAAPAFTGTATFDYSSLEQVSKVQKIAESIDQTASSSQPVQTPSEITEVNIVVKGYVYGMHSGKVPLAGATVNVRGITWASTQSSSTGYYSVQIKAYADGERIYVQISASKTNFLSISKSLWVKFGQTTEIWGLTIIGVPADITVNINLREKENSVTGLVQGKVYNTMDNPVQNALVLVLPYTSDTYGMYSLTNSNGYFEWTVAASYGLEYQVAPTSIQKTVRASMGGFSPYIEKTVTIALGLDMPITDVGKLVIP